MDFFEELFHVSLDGGNGALEILWLLTPLAVLGGVLARRRRRRSVEQRH
jgi:MYXO-CTERM domain-containing protein